ncbi:MAG: type II secretion system protein [Caldiserica bacterium]|nr:type II secretion system protein [Caldisericota bacterium]
MKRNGFTLVELITVVATIPNYLQMTLRAKKARLAADLRVIATALEEFKLDWGNYPKVSTNRAVSDTGSYLTPFKELTGSAPISACQNYPNKRTVFDDKGPISYIKPETLLAIRNPLNSKTTGGHWTGLADQTLVYYCGSTDGSGQNWALWVYGPEKSSQDYYYISDSQATLTAQKIGITTALTIGGGRPGLP